MYTLHIVSWCVQPLVEQDYSQHRPVCITQWPVSIIVMKKYSTVNICGNCCSNHSISNSYTSLVEYCCIDDTSLEHTNVSLPPCWVGPDVGLLYININPPQQDGTWVPSSSDTLMTWWRSGLESTNANCQNKWVLCGTDGRLLLSGFQAVVTLTLTLDRVIRHTVVHQSSTSVCILNAIEIGKTFLWTD